MAKHVDAYDKEKADKAIAIPEMLYSKDGRVYHIRTWEPRVAVDESVTVTVNAFILLEDESDVAT